MTHDFYANTYNFMLFYLTAPKKYYQLFIWLLDGFDSISINTLKGL